MKYILLVVSLFIFNACTVTEPHVTEYRISAKHTEVEFSAKKCQNKSLKIAQAFSANYLMSKKMRYAKDEYNEFSFTQSEWSRSPNRAITDEIVKSIRRTDLFKSVQGYKTRSRSNLVLESRIEEFSQYFVSDEQQSYVRIVIAMSLIDVKSGEIIDTTKLTKSIDVNEINAKGGVKALNQALSTILKDANIWLNEVCE